MRLSRKNKHQNHARQPFKPNALGSILGDRTNLGFYLQNLQHNMPKGSRQNHKNRKVVNSKTRI
jgi:hypothetical protein